MIDDVLRRPVGGEHRLAVRRDRNAPRPFAGLTGDLLIGLRVDDDEVFAATGGYEQILPSAETAVPIGRTSCRPGSLIVCSTRCFCASITVMLPAFSAGT